MAKKSAPQADSESGAKAKKHDIFEDPAIAKSLSEDPIGKVIAKYWQQVAVVVLAVIAGIYIKDQFHRTYEQRLSESGGIYSRAGVELGEVDTLKRNLSSARDKLAKLGKDASEKERGEAEKAVKDAEKNLQETHARLADMVAALGDARAPYSNFGPLFSASLALEDGQAERAQEILGTQDISQGKDSQIAKGRFADELKAFLAAKALLDVESSREQGRALLAELVQNGEIINVAAGITLAKLASTQAQREAALALLQKLVAKQPEQAQLLEPELARLRS